MKFKYRAIDPSEKIVNGVLKDSSREIAIQKLKSRGYKVVKIEEVLEEESFKGTFKEGEIPLLFKEISIMLRSGIDLYGAFVLLKNSSDGKKYDFFSNVEKRLKMGESLGEIFEESKIFSKFVISSIKIAEESENLEETFTNMAEYLQELENIRQEVKKSLIYPIILIFTTMLVVNFLIIFVVPTFVGLYASRDLELPLITKIVVNSSNFIRQNFFYIAILLVLIGISIYYYFGIKKRIIFDRFIARTKTGKIYYTERFVSSLDALLSSGVKPQRALVMIRDSFSNEYLKEIFENVLTNISSGMSISTSLKMDRYFNKLFLEIIEVAEMSSSLDSVVGELSTYYRENLKIHLKKMVSYFEPIVILILAVVVGTIVISVALPMFDIVNFI
ncbi:bacterial type II secretion system domain protein F [Peptoniphilus duerdenii ATCC BAA-1640]|uniref:Bacterial type II secretion system domain protein F n=1 Tax=Peptoniphilus duerdenii ATCC BAA-1640 TaxID=862517 RepID=E0NN68_9FIRM|nr:bacterial type II secretion system domain protein F [Peptoniphilus duerdenii ATCC BAA-1640]